ncbi:MAG: outer membrane lipid asymmetry maintenance protein MlaD [Gammaproteobacteria bacterium]|nr:outer membrane lipid asymmetry maintenance protein MlaD [Gammaproteobacteria bacterium]
MANPRTLEIWVGVFVAAGIAALFMLTMRVSNLSGVLNEGGYVLTARFENISGLKERSPVTMAGVNIGRVTKIGFDPRTYQAIVTMRIDNRFDNLPRDTSAAIFTAGLLGEKYIGMEPGGSDEVLKPGNEIELTQSSLVLEQLIGQFLFNKAAEGDN